MSKRTIRITIDCNDKTCGKCIMNEGDYFCYIYEKIAKGDRCPECIAAEVKR